VLRQSYREVIVYISFVPTQLLFPGWPASLLSTVLEPSLPVSYALEQYEWIVLSSPGLRKRGRLRRWHLRRREPVGTSFDIDFALREHWALLCVYWQSLIVFRVVNDAALVAQLAFIIHLQVGQCDRKLVIWNLWLALTRSIRC
jgi:hypothetical protein